MKTLLISLTILLGVSELAHAGGPGTLLRAARLRKKVAVSNPEAIRVIAGRKAADQTFTVGIDSLATHEIWMTKFQTMESAVTNSDQTLTISVRGKDYPIAVASGTSLQQLAELINAQKIGIIASVYDTGDGSSESARMTVTDLLSGKSNPEQTRGVNFNLGFSSTLTNLTTYDFGSKPLIEGLDSKINLNGLTKDPIYRDSNVIADLFDYVKITLKKESADPITVKIGQ